MKKIPQLTMALFVIFGAFAFAHGQDDNTKTTEHITKLEAELIEATRRLDADKLERFYAPGFVMTVRLPPKLVTRADAFAQLRDPNFRRGTIDSLTTSEMQIQIYGDTAVVTSAWKRVGRDPQGKDLSFSGRLTHVWVKQDGRWMVAAAHYSPNVDLAKLRAEAAAKK